jgi:hypothetical protein
MLDRTSGKVIHIDFGDCFEVAMVREKFPEKIPFRLTRMLINAMEVSYCLVKLIHNVMEVNYCSMGLLQQNSNITNTDITNLWF